MCELGTKPRPDFFYCFKKFSLEIETLPWFECTLRVSQISDKRECACVGGSMFACALQKPDHIVMLEKLNKVVFNFSDSL